MKRRQLFGAAILAGLTAAAALWAAQNVPRMMRASYLNERERAGFACAYKDGSVAFNTCMNDCAPLLDSEAFDHCAAGAREGFAFRLRRGAEK